jgi:predicted aminopeptidase
LTVGYFAETRRQGSGTNEAGLDQWRQQEKKASLRRARFHETYLELERLYARRDISDAQKAIEKERVLAALRAEFQVSGNRTLNNATLIQFKTYFTGQEEFAALLESCGGKWDCFWKRLAPLRADAEKHFERRQQEDFPRVLQTLVK